MPDLTHLLYSRTPDTTALDDAHAFRLSLPAAHRIRGRLEDVCMSLAYFADRTHPDSAGQAQAVDAFFFAASGLVAFLEREGEDPWATLTHARMWAAQHAGQAKEAGHLAAWQVVFHLLDTVPTLEDGEADGLLDTVLSSLALELRLSSPN